MKIALAQILSTQDPAQNLEILESHAREARENGAELVVFPEATMLSFAVPLAPAAEPVDGPWGSAVIALANELNIGIVTGMFTPAEDGKVHNTLLAALPLNSGVEVHTYNKIHLYDAFGYQESATVTPGSIPVTFTFRDITFGLATCYDVRFPDLFIRNAQRGAHATILPTCWAGGPGKREQWEILSRARALDSTSYVLAADQADPSSADPELSPGTSPLGIGYSAIVNPDGSTQSALKSSPGLLYGTITAEAVDAVRTRIPVLTNRRRGLVD